MTPWNRTVRSWLLAASLLSVAIPAAGQSPAPAAAPVPPAAKAPAAPAAPAAAQPTDASKEYEKIWEGPNKAIFDPAFLRSTLKEDDTWTPDEETTKKLVAAQADIEAIIGITRIKACDWKVRTKEDGFDAKVPHWTKLGTTARVLFADARRLRVLNTTTDTAKAVDRVAGLIRLSMHFRGERLVGAVRTGRQLAAMGVLEAKRMAQSGKLDAAMQRTLLEAMQLVNNSDPLDMKDALANESVITREWTKRICLGPSAGKTFIAKFAPRAKQEELDKSGVAQMDEATLHRQIESIDQCYKEVLANWDSPTAGEAIKSIEQQRKNGDFGGPAMLANAEPGLSHHRAATFRLVAMVNDAIKAVTEAKLVGAK